jgi:probable HAF family extracellular repeat protein
MRIIKRIVPPLLLFFGVLAATQVNASYTITAIPDTLGIGSILNVTGVNDSGQVVGTTSTAPFIWQNGTMQSLGTVTGATTYATGINNNGQVIGYAATSNGIYSGLIWQNGVETNLGSLNGGKTEALAINNNGQVTGYSADPGAQSFLWKNGAMVNAGVGVDPNIAYGINLSGQIVGQYNSQTSFLYQNGTMTNLGSLGGPGAAYGVNDNGQVVGYSTNAAGYERPFLWQNGVMQNLGVLGGTGPGIANAINNSGEVVGQSITATQATNAFLWQNGVMTNLNSLLPSGSGWTLTTATAINTNGDIVGTGTLNGTKEGFLLSASTLSPPSGVPEPTSLSVLAIGFLAFLWAGRKTLARP